jgi:hypothetical protein
VVKGTTFVTGGSFRLWIFTNSTLGDEVNRGEKKKVKRWELVCLRLVRRGNKLSSFLYNSGNEFSCYYYLEIA